MVSSISSFILLLFVAISSVSAAPSKFTRIPPRSDHTRNPVSRALKYGVQSYHPAATFQTFGLVTSKPQGSASSFAGGSTASSTIQAPFNLSTSAIEFIHAQLGVDPSSIGYRGGFSWQLRSYAYARQRYNDIPIANAVANIAWFEDQIVAFGSSFIDSSTFTFADGTPEVTFDSIVPTLEDLLRSKLYDHPPTLEYLIRPDNTVALTHVAQFRNPETDTWIEAFACAHSGKLLSITDFVAHASYNVVPINKQGLPDGTGMLTDPADSTSSPLGWHNDGENQTTVTAGNNVIAFGPDGSPASQNDAPLIFDAQYDTTLDPSNKTNIDASTTNAFYVANMVHDIAYKYGFTESAFNFQQTNFEHGGTGGDRVELSVQNSEGFNNANFATPPDGQPGVCRMYIWDSTKPRRDGAMENDIVVHEMTHGITNRMTGGGTGRCLQTTEAGGLGEGWSDTMAEWVVQKSEKVEDFVMGQYVLGTAQGIRTYPYSTNAATNPLRYSNLTTLNKVHAIGEVWANMLHNVRVLLSGTG